MVCVCLEIYQGWQYVKSIVVSFLPYLDGFWGCHSYTFFHLFLFFGELFLFFLFGEEGSMDGCDYTAAA